MSIQTEPAMNAVKATPSRAILLASLMLQLGVVVCVLALIRAPGGVVLYNDPKELVLNLVALISASFCLLSARSLAIDRTDLLLILFLIASMVSASFAATDKWEALRVVGLSISGAAVFWSSRYLARHGRRQQLIDAVSIAVVVVAVSALIDAFGYGLDSPHASSKGTQATRNLAGHLLALGMPLLALQSLGGQTVKRRVGLGALMLTAVALVLTRSRASWIAALLATALPLALLAVNTRLTQPLVSATRCRTALGALIVGVVVGVLLPTQLLWSSPEPYLDSAKGLVAYDRGSGLFRLQEYRRSLAMVADHPALGVGPGNWRIIYPSYLPRNVRPGLWYPRRIHSDWIGFVTERGLPAAVLFLAAIVSLAFGCWKTFISFHQESAYSERSLEPLCALAILLALLVVGSLDAVLQLPAPTLVAFLALGSLAPQRDSVASLLLSWGLRTLAIGTTLLLATTLGTYTLDGMYATFLLARERGDDVEVASRIALDGSWLYNEKFWFWFDKKLKAKVASGRD